MAPKRRKSHDLSKYSLKTLCELVMSYSYPYEDLAELIEEKGYQLCKTGNAEDVIQELKKLSRFFEEMENKNEENVRDLADVYLLAGEFYQCIENFTESIVWFNKAIIVDDVYDLPYHSLAFSYFKLGVTDKAVKCLEQEIKVAPGNYYAYLFLAELYEALDKDEEVETILRDLLSRDSNNIQGLHKLICYYKRRKPELDVEFLRRRLVNADKTFITIEFIIWTYHMSEVGKYEDAIRFLNEQEKELNDISVTHLLKAHLYGILKQYSKKQSQINKFRKVNKGREDVMRTKLDEFAKVFGKSSTLKIEKKLFKTELSYSS